MLFFDGILSAVILGKLKMPKQLEGMPQIEDPDKARDMAYAGKEYRDRAAEIREATKGKLDEINEDFVYEAIENEEGRAESKETETGGRERDVNRAHEMALAGDSERRAVETSKKWLREAEELPEVRDAAARVQKQSDRASALEEQAGLEYDERKSAKTQGHEPITTEDLIDSEGLE